MKRNVIEIKKWLIERGLKQREICAESGMSQPLVSMVINGQRHNPLVLKVLIRRGCPPEFLGVEVAA